MRKNRAARTLFAELRGKRNVSSAHREEIGVDFSSLVVVQQ